MRTSVIALVVGFGLAGLAPAFAGEANYEPFDNNRMVLSTTSTPSRVIANAPADVGSAQYPDVTGRPGTQLTQIDNDVLPSNGSEGVVASANSAPRGFDDGTVAYAQAQSIQRWMLAHNGRATSRVAAR